MQFEHFNLSAPWPKLEILVGFYSRLFGWQPGFRPAFARRGFWLYAGDTAVLHLTESDQHQAAEKPYLDHLAFRGSQPEDFIATLKLMQIPFQQHQIAELNMLQLFFNDPIGTGLEVNFVLNECSGE